MDQASRLAVLRAAWPSSNILPARLWLELVRRTIQLGLCRRLSRFCRVELILLPALFSLVPIVGHWSLPSPKLNYSKTGSRMKRAMCCDNRVLLNSFR